jgi:hypothetical protein
MVHRKRALSLTTMGCCIAPWTSKFRGPDVLDSPQRHQVKELPPSSGGCPLLLYTVGLLMVASPSRLPHSVLLDSWPDDAFACTSPSPPSRPQPPPIAILHVVVDLGLLHQGREARPAPPSAIPTPPSVVPAHPLALLGSSDLQPQGPASHAFAPQWCSTNPLPWFLAPPPTRSQPAPP